MTEAVQPTIADRLRRLVVDLLGVDAAEVQDGTDFREDLGADSLDLIELSIATEGEFGIEIYDDTDHATRFGELVRIVEKRVAKR